MPAPETTALQINFKTRAGTLINIYAVDEADLSAKLEQIESVSSQIGALEGVLNAASSASGISAPPSAQPTGSTFPRQAEAPSNAPSSAAPSCVHGVRRFKEGISKAGKPYKMWACPSSDRNAQCSPEWVN